jgi:hypothetical protein
VVDDDDGVGGQLEGRNAVRMRVSTAGTSRREQSELGKLLYRFWTELLQRAKARTSLHARISPEFFDRLFATKADVEKKFGGAIDWDRLDGQKNSRISSDLGSGSVRDEANWRGLQDRMIDSVIRLEAAMRPYLDAVTA